MPWNNLNDTRESDLAAFEALSVWYAALFFLGYLIVLILPLALAAMGFEYAIGLFTLPVLVYSVVLSRSSIGRGALWFFSKGPSPRAQIIVQAITTVVVLVAFVCFRLGLFGVT